MRDGIRAGLSAPVLLSAVLLPGCAPASEPAVQRAAAIDFHAAVADGDGERACALLAPLTRRELEDSERTVCADAVLAVGLPETDTAVRVQRFGHAGSVLLSGGGGAHDTVFLSRFGDRWLVVAAGCTPRGDLPYHCELEGP